MKEEDLNYIAALEKAIKKKYGQEAIENPASHWDKEKEEAYLEQLQEMVKKQRKSETYSEPENVNGILISKKLFNKDKNLSCPVCSSRLKTDYDDAVYTKFQCCYKCYIQYVHHREDRWLKGWRPEHVTKSS
tara:strand:- start:3629 stop:4024 length:396 start_codon:yes stop_codon:yes gene_type:complete